MTAIALKLNAAVRTDRIAARRVFTWELTGVLTLMTSSTAYALFTLAHLA